MILTLTTLTQSALAFDHTHAKFEAFLSGAVSPEGVDYAALRGKKADLDAYLTELADANTGSFTNDQKLAFYVNAYNANTINLILTEKPASIMDLDGGKVWDTRRFGVGREQMTLNDMEHGKVRKLGDGRIHAVVNCASKGCPPLPPKPLKPEGIQGQLDAAAATWVKTNAYVMDGKVARLSKIFDWYAEDFTGKPKDQATANEKFEAGKAFVSKHGGDVSAATSFEWNDYDWKVNQR